MSRNIAAGIDIGTYQVKVMVTEQDAQAAKHFPRVVAAGSAESKGLRHGYVQNQTEAAQSVRAAVAQAEKAAGVKIRRALLSAGGIGLSSIRASGTVIISRADLEITDLDVKKAVDASQSGIPQPFGMNRQIIHTVPLQYKIDGKAVHGHPTGLKGNKLEVETLFITCLTHHLNGLVETIQEAGIEVEDVVAAPIAASLVTLTKAQKIAGCVLANIGSETASIAVFENNLPISVEVFPIGGSDITNDIALGLKIPLEDAEGIKRGTLVGGNPYPRKKLEEIIEARLSDIFDLIEAHLKKIGKNGLLPAGIILTGGGSSIETIQDIAKAALKLPSRVGSSSLREEIKGAVKDASWSVAYGLCILGESDGDRQENGMEFVKKTKNSITRWLSQFLP